MKLITMVSMALFFAFTSWAGNPECIDSQTPLDDALKIYNASQGKWNKPLHYPLTKPLLKTQSENISMKFSNKYFLSRQSGHTDFKASDASSLRGVNCSECLVKCTYRFSDDSSDRVKILEEGREAKGFIQVGYNTARVGVRFDDPQGLELVCETGVVDRKGKIRHNIHTPKLTLENLANLGLAIQFPESITCKPVEGASPINYKTEEQHQVQEIAI